MILLSLSYEMLDNTNQRPIRNELVSERQKILLNESAFIGEYIAREVGRKITWRCGRLNFICRPDGSLREKLYNFSGCNELDVSFDDKYFDMSNDKKAAYLCDIYRCGLKKFCNRKELDFSVIDDTIKKLQENNYFVGFYVLNSCRRNDYTAKLYCIVDIKHSHFYVDLFHKRKLVNRIPFYQSFPDRLGYFFALGSFEWIDDNTVCLYSHPHYIDNSRETKILKVK